MAQTTEEILITIKTNEKGFEKVNQEVKQLEARLNRLSSGKGNVTNFGWFKDQTATLNNAKIALGQYQNELKNSSGAGIFASNSALIQSSMSGMIAGFGSLYAVKKLWDLSLESKSLEVLRSNFQGAEEDINNFRIATAENVTEGNLIRLSNQASDLGVSLHDQTILFSLAEDAADKYGTSVEEGFQKVITATEGSFRGLKSIGIQKEIYEKIVKDLAKAHGDEIDKLDPEIQKTIRLQAIIQASGVTYDMAINKTQDLADKQQSLGTWLADLTTKYGWSVAKGILPWLGGIEQSLIAIKDFKSNLNTAKNEVLGFAVKLRDAAEDLGLLKHKASDAIVVKMRLEGVEALKQDVDNAIIVLQKKFKDAGLFLEREAKQSDDLNKAKRRTETKKGTESSKENVDLLGKELDLVSDIVKLKGLERTLTVDILQFQLDKVKSLYNEDLSLKDKIRVKEKELEIEKLLVEQLNIKDKIISRQGSKALEKGFGKNALTKTPGANPFMDLEDQTNQLLDEIHTGLWEAWNQSLGITQQIVGLLGLGGSEIISAFREVYSIVMAIVELLRTLRTVSSLLSLIPGVGALGGAIASIASPAGGDSFNGGSLPTNSFNANGIILRPNLIIQGIPKSEYAFNLVNGVIDEVEFRRDRRDLSS